MAEPLVDHVKKQVEVANNTLRGTKNASQVQDGSIFADATLTLQEVENETSRGEEDPLEIQDKSFDEATLRFYKAEMENNLREEALFQMMQDESVFKAVLTQQEVETFLRIIKDASKEQDERTFYDATLSFLTFRIINDILRGDKEAFQQNFTKLDILNEELEEKLEELQMNNLNDEMKNLKFSKLRRELKKKTLETEKKMNSKQEELDKLMIENKKTNCNLMEKENELAELSDQFLEDMDKLIQLNDEYLKRSRSLGLRKDAILQLK